MSTQSASPLPVFVAERAGSSVTEFARNRIEHIKTVVLERGGILFRGFHVTEPADHQALIDVLGVPPMAYTYRSTPRTHVYRDILTATEYPPQLEIPLHCENAYQRSWPMWISLCCLTPATGGGGETPIASMRQVTAAIPRDVIDRFAARGVKYIRNYRPHVDLPWQDVFGTSDRDEVARFCDANEMHHAWVDRDTLRTEQVCQGVAKHPVTGDTVFFNQAHLFHVSSLGAKATREMISFFGRDGLPRDARFGDGQEIGASDFAAVRAAFDSAAMDLQWQRGDVVIVDNMQFAHGRRAFSGERRVLAALLNPHRPQ